SSRRKGEAPAPAGHFATTLNLPHSHGILRAQSGLAARAARNVASAAGFAEPTSAADLQKGSTADSLQIIEQRRRAQVQKPRHSAGFRVVRPTYRRDFAA